MWAWVAVTVRGLGWLLALAVGGFLAVNLVAGIDLWRRWPRRGHH